MNNGSSSKDTPGEAVTKLLDLLIRIGAVKGMTMERVIRYIEFREVCQEGTPRQIMQRNWTILF